MKLAESGGLRGTVVAPKNDRPGVWGSNPPCVTDFVRVKWLVSGQLLVNSSTILLRLFVVYSTTIQPLFLVNFIRHLVVKKSRLSV